MPTLEELLKESTEIVGINNASEEQRNLELAKSKADLEGRKDFYNLRKTWSAIIAIFITVLLMSQIVIVFYIGLKVLVYNSTIVISIFFTETFAQIIALAILVVKFLFADKK